MMKPTKGSTHLVVIAQAPSISNFSIILNNCRYLISQDDSIVMLFAYMEGVGHALSKMNDNYNDLRQDLSHWIISSGVQAIACSKSIDDICASQTPVAQNLLVPGWEIAGLVSFYEALQRSDHLVWY